MDSLAVLDPNDPSPGYCLYTGSVNGFTNIVFEIFMDESMSIRLVRPSRGYYRYDEASNAIVAFSSPETGWAQGIIDGAGLGDLVIVSAVVIDDFTKSLILYKALPAEEP